ncbi:MAG: hypothetical protein ACRD2J_12120 [Thermoanaerobaculia bacterium]
MKKVVLLVALLALLVPAAASAQEMSPQMERVFDDVTRLQATLVDVSSDHDFSDAVWRTVVNEANMLANRIFAGTRGWRAESADAARELRTHVREMRQSALAGNEAEAKEHARLALPFANTIAGRIRS